MLLQSDPLILEVVDILKLEDEGVEIFMPANEDLVREAQSFEGRTIGLVEDQSFGFVDMLLNPPGELKPLSSTPFLPAFQPVSNLFSVLKLEDSVVSNKRFLSNILDL